MGSGAHGGVGSHAAAPSGESGPSARAPAELATDADALLPSGREADPDAAGDRVPRLRERLVSGRLDPGRRAAVGLGLVGLLACLVAGVLVLRGAPREVPVPAVAVAGRPVDGATVPSSSSAAAASEAAPPRRWSSRSPVGSVDRGSSGWPSAAAWMTPCVVPAACSRGPASGS